MKDPKTTTVAIIGGLILFVLVGALIFKQIDGPTFGEAAGAVGTFLGVLIGLFSADSKKAI
jgi:TRAP-type mannitol/chloroaromatic compound transport system permease large subunit